MENNELKPKSIKPYIILSVVVIGVILTVCGINGLFTEELPPKQVVRYVCDAFFVAGALVLAIAGLTWCGKQGAFDGIGYSFSFLFDLRKPSNKRLTWKKKESFEEYVERKRAKDSKKTIKHFLIIGGILILVSAILLIVYNTAF